MNVCKEGEEQCKKFFFSKPEKFGFASQPSALDLTYLSSSQPALDVRSTKAEYYKKLAADFAPHFAAFFEENHPVELHEP